MKAIIQDTQSRFYGQACTVVNSNGACYFVRLDDGLCLCCVAEQLKFFKNLSC